MLLDSSHIDDCYSRIVSHIVSLFFTSLGFLGGKGWSETDLLETDDCFLLSLSTFS